MKLQDLKELHKEIQLWDPKGATKKYPRGSCLIILVIYYYPIEATKNILRASCLIIFLIHNIKTHAS